MSVAAPELTPWFPGNVKPARPGVYQRKLSWGTRYAKWDGRVWLGYYYEPYSAAVGNHISAYQLSRDIEWRGLAKDPNNG